MKLTASAASILLLLGAAASAQTLDDLKKDGNGVHRQRPHLRDGLSTDTASARSSRSTRQTIKRLVPVWNLSLDNDWGEQAQPLVHNGVMYVTNAHATVAIDVATGKQIWKQTLDWPPETPRVVCCGVSNKGAAIYDGKVYRTTLDAYVVAYDAKTGKEIWKTKVGEWKDGISLTLAPLIANGVLVIGNSGAEFGVRGFIDGYDTATGKQLWRRYTIPAQGREGQRDLAAGQQRLGGRRRLGLDHRLLRSRARPHVLGHRQSGAVGVAVAPRRQPLHLVGAGDAAEDRRDRLALPVHAERRLRLRRLLGADHRRQGHRRREAQSDHAAQPQRLPLRDRPHQRQAARRQPVREGELGEPRRQGDRPAGRDRRRQEAARRRADRALAVDHAAARTGRTPPTIRRPGSSTPTPSTRRACSSTWRPSRTWSGSATCTSRTSRSRSSPARRPATSRRSIR